MRTEEEAKVETKVERKKNPITGKETVKEETKVEEKD